MKKTLRILSILTCIAILFSGVSCKEKEVSDGKTAIDPTLFNEYAHENIFETTFTEDGLKMVGNQNLRAACSKMRFPIKDGNKISITFAVPVFEEDSEKNIVSGTSMYTKTSVDMIIIGQTLQKPTAQIRLWADRTVGQTTVKGRIGVKYDGSFAYDSSFEKDALSWANTGEITGNMRMSTPFTLEFDLENFFSSYLGGTKDEIKPILNKDGTDAEKKLYSDFTSMFTGVNSVSVVFRFSGWTYEDLQNMGYTGFESSSCIYFQEINGQSLKTADGRIVDNAKPFIAAPELAEATTLSAYTSYVYEVKSNEENEVGKSTVLYSAFASDVLSWKELSYAIIVTDPDGKTTMFDGLNFTIGKAGIYKVSAKVKDSSGNEYTSPEREFTVTDTYRINLNGEIVTTAKKGSKVTIPTAYVTNAEGGRVDANGNAYTYTVEVMSPLEMEVPIVDGKITVNRAGTYRVKYTSSSEDGSDVKEFLIVVK